MWFMVPFSTRIDAAIKRAAQLHSNQFRKGNESVPYVIHPFAVAFILVGYTDDEDVIVAALLHDVLEDVKSEYYSYDDMSNEFGERVLSIVQDVTENKDGYTTRREEIAHWDDRKNGYVAHLAHACQEALLVCCADKIHNIQSLVQEYRTHGSALWQRFNASPEKMFRIYERIIQVLKQRLDSPLVGELEKGYVQAVQELHLTLA